MKYYERIITIIMLCVISLSNVATPVAYAAQLGKFHFVFPSHSSVDPSGLTKVPRFAVGDHGSVLGASSTLFTIGTQKLDLLHTGNSDSALERIPLHVDKLDKKVYETTEDVALTVENPDNEPFTTSVSDADGKSVSVPITESNTGATTTVDLAPSNQIKPGLYKVTVTDAQNKSTEQDFTWGVLALNTDKSMYHPGEKADIAMAVLNDKGDMVCDATVQLKVQNSNLKVDDTLSTQNGKITVNPQCQKHDYSMQPDYETHYTFTQAGTYSLQLTATTSNGTRTITDTVQVTDKIPFDLQRVSATRIYPPNTYPMIFNITANRDFSGTVTETVPDSFTITPATQSASQSYNAMQTVYLNSNDPAALMSQQIASGSGGLVMPFHGDFPITQGFGVQLTDPSLQAFYTHYGLGGHDGIDFGVPMNTPLYAVDEGDIIWSGPGDYGTMVTIQHGWGKTYYGHMSNTSVTVGQHVEKGQLLGYSGMTGEATGPHLHFGMKPNNPDMSNGYYGKIDPMPFLPVGQGESISALGAEANPVANLVYNTTVLGASDSATPTPSDIPSATPTQIPTPTTSSEPTAIPTPTPTVGSESSTQASGSAQTISVTPTPTLATSGDTTPAFSIPADTNSNFSVLDKEIKLNEEIANSSLTQKVKVLTWKVSLKKGESTTLGYDYQTPKISPQFYLLGPAKFYDGSDERLVFQEQRQWQIAADDVGIEWYQNSGGPHDWNGYSWQYRKKIDISSNNVYATPSAQTVDFMDSGGDATGQVTTANGGFYNSTITANGNTVAADSSTSETGPDSIKFNNLGNTSQACAVKTSILADAGRRISGYFKFSGFSSGRLNLMSIDNSGDTQDIINLDVTSAGVLQLFNDDPSGTQIGSNGPTLSTNTWYRLSIAYTITNTTTYSVKAYVNGVQAISASNSPTLKATATSDLAMGICGVPANSNSFSVNMDDLYIDSGTDLSDPGDIHVTAKRPNANGTSNQFTTQIGAGGSGYGSGHSPQVNERPISTTNGWSISTTTKQTEEYNIESRSQGDVNIPTGAGIAGYMGWMYAKESTTSNTPVSHLILNGSATAETLTTSDAMYTQISSTTTYPAGTGTDIGMDGQYTSVAGTYTLEEAGIQVAYIPDLINFPVLVSLTSDSDLSAYAQASGNDILFTDSTGRNLLPFEIESYSSGTLAAWVDIASLPTGNDTIIYMYYGNPSTASKANASGTWDSNYQGVWHLGEGTNTTAHDSTTNANTGTLSGGPTWTTGEISNALNFNTQNAIVNAGTGSSLTNISPCRINLSSVGA